MMAPSCRHWLWPRLLAVWHVHRTGHTVTKVLCPKPFLFQVKGTGSPPFINEIKNITKIPLATTPKGLSFQGKKAYSKPGRFFTTPIWPKFHLPYLSSLGKPKTDFHRIKNSLPNPDIFLIIFLPPMKSSNMLLTRKKNKKAFIDKRACIDLGHIHLYFLWLSYALNSVLAYLHLLPSGHRSRPGVAAPPQTRWRQLPVYRV